VLKRPVIGLLSIVRKTAGRKVSHFKMITDTFTADSLA
jgi:hypothetical protein